MAAPAISVVMPVHNALPYLDEAIESILGQTFSDFEFVILDDGSTDGSTERLREWAAKDPRIRLLEERSNLGPTLSSDRVARAASAPIVARMDADDVSRPGRLLAQLEVLRDYPGTGAVGTLCDIIDARGCLVRGPEPWRLARPSWMVPFPHGALMYRRELFERVGGYRDGSELWEDQDLIGRMAGEADVMVIPQPLYRVRQTATSTRLTSDLQRQETSLDQMYRSLDSVDVDGARDKVDPRVIVAIGSTILWSGSRPSLFRRFLRRARLGADLHSLAALLWTAWASASPATLRAFLRMRLAARNALAARRVNLDRPLMWHRPGKPVAGRGTRG
jgi:glycosyltransferase involved in cell wall biosynthesis